MTGFNKRFLQVGHCSGRYDLVGNWKDEDEDEDAIGFEGRKDEERRE